MTTDQQEIDKSRAEMAQEIVDGQAGGRPAMTIDEWKRFAHAWIVTAAQHASNESYYCAQRDAAVRALEEVAKLGGGGKGSSIATEALKELHSSGEEPPMKILPSMSKGVVFVHEDGKSFEIAPFQVFISAGGQTVIRIGRNAVFFDKDGRFDGTESRMLVDPTSPEAKAVHDAYEVQGEYKGLPPDEPYFHPGTPGHTAETRAWASAKREDGGKMYTAVPDGKPDRIKN